MHYDETGKTYVDAYFVIRCFYGVPTIREADKRTCLAWFPLQALPDDLLDIRRHAIDNFLHHVPYDELGWEAT